jgi:hypothetical protein
VQVPLLTIWFGIFPIILNWWAALGLSVYYVATTAVRTLNPTSYHHPTEEFFAACIAVGPLPVAERPSAACSVAGCAAAVLRLAAGREMSARTLLCLLVPPVRPVVTSRLLICARC